MLVLIVHSTTYLILYMACISHHLQHDYKNFQQFHPHSSFHKMTLVMGWAQQKCHMLLNIQNILTEKIKTHGSVSCGPRKRGARKRSEYIDRNNKVAIFTHP